jgi:dTMP kinase
MKGKLITFESMDGSGKTTQIKLLEKYLKEKGHEIVVGREPGGVEFSEDLRKQFILNPDKYEINSVTEMFLFCASRSEFVEKFVKKYLEEGKIVLLDRFYDSTLAYQGYGGQVDVEEVEKVCKIAVQEIKPDMTILIKPEVEEAMKRISYNEYGKPDRFEKKGVEFQRKVMEGYLEIAKNDPERIKVIEYVENGIDKMQDEIRGYVDELLQS